MTSIHIKSVTKRFGTAAAVDAVSLDINAGELFFLLGPSGCGKTTLLRMLAGFVQPDAGDIFFGEQRINDLPPRKRDAGMVFQTYALWPHMTVAKNVAYGLHVRGLGRAEVERRVAEVLRLVRMETLGERRPNQLSGGQQQRVALARALVVKPRVLLLDEPLSNLDARLRDEMREEIRRLHAETRLTMVYVTHDQKEALSLADRLAVMQNGRLMQIGTAAEVYDRPVNRFVAGFLGDSNFLSGTVRAVSGNQCTVDTVAATLVGVPVDGTPKIGSRVVCSIRPHALAVTTESAGPNRIAATVVETTFLGELLHVRLAAKGDTRLHLVSLPQGESRCVPGETLTLAAVPEQVVVLSESA